MKFPHIYVYFAAVKTNQLLHNELAGRIKKGEAIAFELLFKMYFTSLTRYASVLLRNTETSSEIVQDTFLKIWETRSAIDPEKPLKAYIYRCVHNNCVNYLKKMQVNIKLSEEYRTETMAYSQFWETNDSDTYFEMMLEEKRIDAINKAIDNLPQQCREIFILCRFENYSYKQIAEKLKISVNTVKTQLQRAMAKLKEVIK